MFSPLKWTLILLRSLSFIDKLVVLFLELIVVLLIALKYLRVVLKILFHGKIAS